jgi:CRISPR/Cas system-associated protein Csm6
MKTTVDISDQLLDEARRLASRERTTLRALIEEGLRRIVTERKRTGPFRLRKATFKGEGLQPAVAGSSWDRLREMAYEGRGG